MNKNLDKKLIITSIILTLIYIINSTLAAECKDNDGDYWGDVVTNTTPCIDQGACNCGDCNDNNPNIAPGMPEGCDGIDTNCDGFPSFLEADSDNDTVMICVGDCNDNNNTIYPGAAEGCDGIDTNCDGLMSYREIDEDVDSFTECQNDCNDGDKTINPSAIENCTDEIDNNCNNYLDCKDSECAQKPICTEIPEYPSIVLAPIITVFSIMLLKLARVF